VGGHFNVHPCVIECRHICVPGWLHDLYGVPGSIFGKGTDFALTTTLIS
jgi:hypothetical protein